MNLVSKSMLIACSALVCIVVFYRFNQKTTPKKPTLIVGVMSGYPPFCQMAPNGQLEGFDIDVAQELARNLNCTLQIKDMSLATLLLALQQNQLDLVLSGLCITQERMRSMNMVYYQGTPRTTFPLVFWKNVPNGVTTVQDCATKCNAPICVEPGSAQEKFLLSFPNLALKQICSMSEIVMELKYGKCSAALLDPDIAPSIIKQTPELVTLNVELPSEYQTQGCGIAINKNNNALTAKITALVNTLKANGFLQNAQMRWFERGLQ